jgi:coproporphyrinogen III oxidase-like Fe-S oxidoreductase
MLTGRSRWRLPWPQARTTSRPTRSSWRRAPGWPPGSGGASCPPPTTTRWPTATWRPTELFGAAGLRWYEISNWAAGDASACRHNLLYWTDGDWWGIGPGAHSHVGGTRWWNVRHPAGYAARLAAGTSPGQAREVLTPRERSTERIMLQTRLAAGLPVTELDQAGTSAAAAAVADGLADRAAFTAGRVVLTRRGRLLADAVIRGLTG